MSKEIDNSETMSKNKSKKTVKKKVTPKFQASMQKKAGSNPKPDTSKPEISPPSQKVKVAVQKFEDLEGKFLLVKVGDDKNPASNDDIKDIETKLTGLLEENDVNCLAFVTHHAVEISIVEKLV